MRLQDSDGAQPVPKRPRLEDAPLTEEQQQQQQLQQQQQQQQPAASQLPDMLARLREPAGTGATQLADSAFPQLQPWQAAGDHTGHAVCGISGCVVHAACLSQAPEQVGLADQAQFKVMLCIFVTVLGCSGVCDAVHVCVVCDCINMPEGTSHHKAPPLTPSEQMLWCGIQEAPLDTLH